MDGRRGGAMPTVVSAFRVMVVCCWAAAAAITIPEAVRDDGGGGGGDAGRTAVKRSDPTCPDDGCTAFRCPSDRDACPLGLMPDGCACCPYGVCGLGEARECDTAGRPCADQLECVKMEPSSDDDYGGDRAALKVTYRCACKVQEPVCGSDNRTYSNVCQLNEAKAASSGSIDNETTTTLWMQYSGPCQSAPIIQSVPKNYDSSIGQPVVFDCEVKGYPVPSISWRFTDTLGITKWLPGDDTLMAIQTRGGPDRLTVTSWVQIMEFKPHHIGNYTCLGTNLVDTATASGVLNIRKMS